MRIKTWMGMAALAGTVLWTGCGGDDADANLGGQTDVVGEVGEAESKGSVSRRSSTATGERKGGVALVGVNEALDKGDYSSAVDQMYKAQGSGASASDMMMMQREVQSAIAKAMASGDPEAIKAANNMKKVMEMQMRQAGRGR